MEDCEEVLQLANRLLQHTGIARYVQNLRQCNSFLFTQFYEALTGSKVPGLVLHAPTSESVKCQAVVDALSRHLHPHVSLSHIRGQLLAQHDTMAIRHLLDIYSLLFHLPESPKEEESEEEEEADDSNTISNEGLTIVSEVIREELGTSYSTDSTAELLCPVPRARLPDLRPSRGAGRDESSSITGPSSPSHSSHVPSSSHSDRVDRGECRLSGHGRECGHCPTHEGTPLSITTLEDTTDTQGETSPTPPPASQGLAFIPPLHILEMGKPPLHLPSHQLPPPSPTIPSTPPRHKTLRPPLHQSTPHVSTRSRVFGSNVPRPSGETVSLQEGDRGQAESPTGARRSPQEPSRPSLGGAYYYTELTHPPRLERAELEREPVHVTRGAHSAPEGLSRPGEGGDQRVATSGQSPQLQPVSTSKVSSATQTGLSELSASSEEEEQQEAVTGPTADTSIPDRPESDGQMVRFSSPTHLRDKGRQTHLQEGGEEEEEEEEGEGGLHQKLDLEGQIAMTRASVLSTLYQNYLKELKASSKSSSPPAVRPQRAKTSVKSRTAAKPRPAVQRRPKVKPAGHPPSLPPSGQPSASEDGGEHTGLGDEDHNSGVPTPKATPKKVALGDDMLPLVENEFPFVHVSPSTMRRLWQKQLQQITALTRPQAQQQQQPTAVKKITEMDRRHRALLQVVRKELNHTRRMQKQIEQRQRNQAVKSTVRARRQATARARKYYNDYELRLKAKLQRRRTKEEQVFRRAFEEGLELQRERVREVRRYAKEKKQSLARQQQDHLESLENYYRDQFAMLAESIAREREEVAIRDKAQNQLVRRMRRELRERIEREIEQLQECIDREEDSVHFRELDAQGLHHKLTKMTFTTSVK